MPPPPKKADMPPPAPMPRENKLRGRLNLELPLLLLLLLSLLLRPPLGDGRERWLLELVPSALAVMGGWRALVVKWGVADLLLKALSK